MSLVTEPHGTLETAFRRFEKAASSLEQCHSDLRDKVNRLERQLLDAHRRLETVVDALDGGVAVVSRDGRLIRTNRAFDALGLVDEERSWKHSRVAELVAPDAGTARTKRVEIRRGRLDLAVTLIPVGDEDATRVLTVQDVTEIRRQEEEGGRRRRLEALGRMAAELAHEVRNPLGSIRLFACMLQEDLEDEKDQRAMVEQILAATAGLEGTVSNLLAFSAPSRGARRRLDLSRIAVEACSLFEPACSVRGVRLDAPDESTPCWVEGEPEGLRQIVLNLLGNSLAATDDGGRIGVEARREGDLAVLEVSDDGRGIDPDDLPRVFDPFFSRAEGGTGLGLSIVHSTVERHAGRITLDSGPGPGTVARVELPLDGDTDA